MKELFTKYDQLLEARVRHNKGFNGFGEDSVRYDFYFALQGLFNLAPHELMLEQEIPNTQYVAKTPKPVKTGQGRKKEKPEVDLIVHPTESFPKGLVAEFAYFRTPPIAANSAKPANHGKLIEDIFRLAMMKEHVDFKDYSHLMICLTDVEMIDYGMPGTRGSHAVKIQENYRLTEEFLSSLSSTTNKVINKQGFRKKANYKRIVPRANRIVSFEHPRSSKISKWALWIWEVDFD